MSAIVPLIGYHRRKASFTDVEAYILTGLLIDDNNNSNDNNNNSSHTKAYNKSVPSVPVDTITTGTNVPKLHAQLTEEILLSVLPQQQQRHFLTSSKTIVQPLWKNYEDGIHPRSLIRQPRELLRQSLVLFFPTTPQSNGGFLAAKGSRYTGVQEEEEDDDDDEQQQQQQQQSQQKQQQQQQQQKQPQNKVLPKLARKLSTLSNSKVGISSEHGSASELAAKAQLRKSEFLKRPRSSLLLLRNTSTNGTRHSSTGTSSTDPLCTPSEVHDDDNVDNVDDNSCHSFDSDMEVRRERTPSTKHKDTDDNDCVASQSSSIHDDEHFDHYNTWEVLRDEYAEEYGFSYDPMRNVDNNNNDDDDDDVYNTFHILGTSADDISAQPHVLSPPLMDSLMTFLPDNLQSTNYWLRYSLVRDGASLDTMKRYCYLCKDTILAIETTQGNVFGCYTSSVWNNNYSFYGSLPSFVWKMRHNRTQTVVSSLYEQAHIESIIDVYMCTNKLKRIQVCRHDGIAVGGDETTCSIGTGTGTTTATTDGKVKDSNSTTTSTSSDGGGGFAIALFDYGFSRGTTSQSTVFNSPSLIGRGDQTEIFDVAGLEVWSFTPCFDVPSAERLEMSKFITEESYSSLGSSSDNYNKDSSHLNDSNTALWQQSQDTIRNALYRRVGNDDPGNGQREMFKYDDAMQNLRGGYQTSSSRSGFGQASPRFQ